MTYIIILLPNPLVTCTHTLGCIAPEHLVVVLMLSSKHTEQLVVALMLYGTSTTNNMKVT